MKSRFLRKNYLPTLNIIASSKNSEQSFLEDFINTKKENESKTTMIVDEPQWVVDSRKVTDEWFYVGIGNKFLSSELLPLNANDILIDEYRSKGYSILKVPLAYYENFQDNIDGSLADIAGIATVAGLKYISGMRWNEIKTDEYENPFTKDVITVGTNDNIQYSNFFDLSKIPNRLKERPLYIAMDMSIKGDKTGIGGTYILGKLPKVEGESNSKELFYQIAFNVSVAAPKGYEISFDKNRAFIRWLRDQGFNIKSISFDTYQSAQLTQQLIADGFNVTTISVDRLDSETKRCMPYEYFKSTIYEKRVKVYKKCDLLTEEIIGLEREADGHINHPGNGTQGCFTGDTKVSLVDGRELTFLELVDEFNSGKQNYVYSFNEEKKIIEPKLIENAWCTKKNAKIIEVDLDNGEVLRCTPNHKFMLRDGIYCEAQNLKCGDSLMPLYRKYPDELISMHNYRMYYEPIEDEWHYEHRKFATEVLDEKYLVHHKDCNPKNNDPTNLVWCSKQKHQQIHKELSTGAQSPEAKAKKSASLKSWYKNNKELASKKNYKARLTRLGITEEEYLANKLAKENKSKLYWKSVEKNKQDKLNYIKAIEDMFNVSWYNLTPSEKDSYAVKYQRYLHPETQEAISASVSKNHSLGKYANAYIALNKCNEESKLLKELIPNIDKEKFEQIFGISYDSLDANKKASYVVKYRRIVGKEIRNHKVISIRKLDEVADVYDITVQDNHNFALSAGVFVHNSKDSSDAVCASIWNASQHAEEFAFDYGENYTTLLDVNSSAILSGQEQHQLTVDFESELNNLFDPVAKQVLDNEDYFKAGMSPPSSDDNGSWYSIF